MKEYTIVINNNTIKSFLNLLTISFIVLKLLGVIQWSWFWVLSPIWIVVVLFTILFIIITIIEYVIYS